jgi:caa(3)-type oxidase subunit IV
MTETETPTTEHHAETNAKIYLVIFAALAVFTAASFLANDAMRHEIITPYTSFALILGVAICKTVLVAMFFMHLKLDWSRLYFVIIPVMLLATMMVIVLLPDIVLSWRQVKSDDEQSSVFPGPPLPGIGVGAEEERLSIFPPGEGERLS